MLASWHVPQKKMNITRVGQYSIVRMIHNTARLLAHIERINYCILLTHNFSMSGESSAVLLRRHRRCGESRPRRRLTVTWLTAARKQRAGTGGGRRTRRRQFGGQTGTRKSFVTVQHMKRCGSTTSTSSSDSSVHQATRRQAFECLSPPTRNASPNS